MHSFFKKLPAGGFLDKTGASVSVLCALHCLLLPLVLTILPLGGLSFLADEKIEWTLISFAFLIGSISLFPAYFTAHRKLRPLLLFVFGIALIIAANLLLEDLFFWNALSVLTGAALISIGHFLNIRLTQRSFNPAAAPRKI